MPLQRGSIQLYRFRVVEAPDPSEGGFEALVKRAFEPLNRETGEEERAVGWVSVLDGASDTLDPSLCYLDGDLILGWRVDQVRVPSALVKEQIDAWRPGFEERRGRRPSKRETEEQKEYILRDLRKQAFVSSKVIDVRWRVAANELQIWATSAKMIEEIAVALEEDLSMQLRSTGPGPRWEDAELPTDGLAPTAALFGEEASLG